MHIQILQENLQKGLQVVNRFTAQQSQLPILSQIALLAEDNQLYLTATDMQVGIRLRVAAKILEPGSMAVPGRILTELVKSLPVGMIELVGDEIQPLHVSAGKSKATLQTTSVKDFPIVEAISASSTSLQLTVEQVAHVVEKIGFVLSTDDSRPVLTGMYWHLPSGLVAATDGFRLSVVENVIPPITPQAETEFLIVNGKLLHESLRVLRDVGERKVSWFYEEAKKQLYLQGEEVLLVGRLLQGEYPHFQAIMPKQENLKIRVDTQAFLRAVASAAIFARDNAQIVTLAVTAESMTVQAQSQQVGQNTCVVEVENSSGKTIELAFNSRYLLDFLNQAQKDKLLISFQGSLEAVLFMEEGDELFKHVIMPMRLQGS